MQRKRDMCLVGLWKARQKPTRGCAWEEASTASHMLALPEERREKVRSAYNANRSAYGFASFRGRHCDGQRGRA